MAFPPWVLHDIALVESFNGSCHVECLNNHWLLTLEYARSEYEASQTDYSELWRHSWIDSKAPIESSSTSGRACRLGGK